MVAIILIYLSTSFASALIEMVRMMRQNAKSFNCEMPAIMPSLRKDSASVYSPLQDP